MFLGSYSYKLDQKSRFRVPTAFKEILNQKSSKFCLYKGIDGCYILSTREDFEKLISKLNTVTPINPNKELQKAKRLILQYYKEIEEDSQGRYVLPKTIRDDKDFMFDGELIFAGMGEHVEVWSKKKYENMYEGISYDDALSALNEIEDGQNN